MYDKEQRHTEIMSRQCINQFNMTYERLATYMAKNITDNHSLAVHDPPMH